MNREIRGDEKYWNERIINRVNAIKMAENEIKKQPVVVPQYEPQYIWNYALDQPRLTITQYSRGDQIRSLYVPFPKVLDAWEFSNQKANAICQSEHIKTCRDWTFDLCNLEHYQWCQWLIALALLQEIDEVQWQRLLALVGGEGQDAVLDRLIATRSPQRMQGTKVLHKKPYARLWAAMQATPDQQPLLLRDFVEHWYAELKRPASKTIWWYDFGNPEINPLEKGSYFGRWCLEAVATAKALNIDDSLCLGHEHYPGDFLRPDGPSTHPDRSGIVGKIKKWFLNK